MLKAAAARYVTKYGAAGKGTTQEWTPRVANFECTLVASQPAAKELTTCVRVGRFPHLPSTRREVNDPIRKPTWTWT